MIYYFDTSAIIKKYVSEDGTARVLKLFAGNSHVATSVVAYAEVMAAVARKYREGIVGREDRDLIAKQFSTDWIEYNHIHVSDPLLEKCTNLVFNYPLRGFDAIHLASAILAQESTGEEIVFICSDRRLRAPASDHGLQFLDPSEN